MSAKQSVKKIVPSALLQKAKSVKKSLADRKVNTRQMRRFSHWVSRPDSADKARIETRLTFDIHRLEKGLSHKDFRYGFGKQVVSEILVRMHMLQRADPDYAENPIYLQGLAVLHEYQERHRQAGYDLTWVNSFDNGEIWKSAEKYSSTDADNHVSAGSKVLERDSKCENARKPFTELAMERYSVREYSMIPVDPASLNKAYDIAMKTPSVCNRQATRIYEITNKEVIRQALNIQGGFSGYKDPPVLLFVTSDIRAFMDSNERNEPFVDGGLFAMSLLYALEANGLAACPLNAMFSAQQDEKTRKLLGIPEFELPIMYIAVGNFPEEVPVCVSYRKTSDSIVKKVK